jgi:glutamyl-tRNA synthetase/glutamyl-Q tRNA(Asp) synthetase
MAALPGPSSPRPSFTTRFAPAPTGLLHLGHVASAVWVWGAARALGGHVLLRIEDHDRVRSRPAFERALLADLDWLGFVPDAPPVRQSERQALYERALATLERRGLVYVCACSRREILEAAPDDGAPELRYPGTCRERGLAEAQSPMRRIRLERLAVPFADLLAGALVQVPAEQCGDLLARDRDGNWTYQLAVTVDDLEQGVDLVVRGADVLASTGRQIQLAALLGRATPPRFLHHPLLLRADGGKLSKSSGDTGVRELRAAGWSPARVLGAAAHALGLVARAGDIAQEDLASLVGARLAAALGDARGAHGTHDVPR